MVYGFDPKLSPPLANFEQVAKELDTSGDAVVPPSEDHEAHAEGEVCVRCKATLTAHDEVRRSAAGGWVHDTCPTD